MVVPVVIKFRELLRRTVPVGCPARLDLRPHIDPRITVLPLRSLFLGLWCGLNASSIAALLLTGKSTGDAVDIHVDALRGQQVRGFDHLGQNGARAQ